MKKHAKRGQTATRKGHRKIQLKLLRVTKYRPNICEGRHHQVDVGLTLILSVPQAVGSRVSGKAVSSLGLSDFDLLRVIGRGSYAKVLLVRLKKTERIYAMKVVKKELVNDDEVTFQLSPDAKSALVLQKNQ